MHKVFFELLQVAIGNRASLSIVPDEEQWKELFALAKKQALVGICYAGILKLPKEQMPSQMILLRWVGTKTQIVQRNKLSLDVCRKLYQKYKTEGFSVCVMKGQANKRYYPLDIAELRTSGDIDLWLSNWTNHSVKDVMALHVKRNDIVSLCYLHIENHPVDGIPVEVHFRPSFMNGPITNRRFLGLFDKGAIEHNDALGFDVLKVEKDIVFQMNHLYRHLLDEGVGLRQVLDYWFLLTSKEGRDVISVKREQIVKDIEDVGMKRFSSALMWVLVYVLESNGDDKDTFSYDNWILRWPWMICKPNEKEGKFLLNEIMLSGNFGKYDPRMKELEVKKGKTSYQVKRAWRRMKRNFHFINDYPSEVICEPFARISHFLWRRFELWRY